MTVSKALRGTRDIAPQTKARLQLLAQQMGYVPNSMAQGLRNRNTKLLGLIVSTVANPIVAGAVPAIEEAARQLGWKLNGPVGPPALGFPRFQCTFTRTQQGRNGPALVAAYIFLSWQFLR